MIDAQGFVTQVSPLRIKLVGSTSACPALLNGTGWSGPTVIGQKVNVAQFGLSLYVIGLA